MTENGNGGSKSCERSKLTSLNVRFRIFILNNISCLIAGQGRVGVHAGADADWRAGVRGRAEDRALPLAEDHQARLQAAETDARRRRGRRGRQRGSGGWRRRRKWQGEGAHLRIQVRVRNDDFGV